MIAPHTDSLEAFQKQVDRFSIAASATCYQVLDLVRFGQLTPEQKTESFAACGLPPCYTDRITHEEALQYQSCIIEVLIRRAQTVQTLFQELAQSASSLAPENPVFLGFAKITAAVVERGSPTTRAAINSFDLLNTLAALEQQGEPVGSSFLGRVFFELSLPARVEFFCACCDREYPMHDRLVTAAYSMLGPVVLNMLVASACHDEKAAAIAIAAAHAFLDMPTPTGQPNLVGALRTEKLAGELRAGATKILDFRLQENMQRLAQRLEEIARPPASRPTPLHETFFT